MQAQRAGSKQNPVDRFLSGNRRRENASISTARAAGISFEASEKPTRDALFRILIRIVAGGTEFEAAGAACRPDIVSICCRRFREIQKQDATFEGICRGFGPERDHPEFSL
jgi:hypothetical protein